jgi:hypothetical protein
MLVRGPEEDESMSGHHSAHRDIDRLLSSLRLRPDAYRCDEHSPGIWHAYCPVCQRSYDGEYRRLTIVEHSNGTVGLTCEGACLPTVIVSRLVLDERRAADAHFRAVANIASVCLEEVREARRIARLLMKEAA